MATSNDPGVSDSEDIEAELIDGLQPEMRERVRRVRGFAEDVRRCLRRLRQEQCNWSQRDLADRIGVSTSTISRLENGRGFGGIDLNLVALAFDAMDAAPGLSVFPQGHAAGWRVQDSTGRASAAGGQAAEQARGNDRPREAVSAEAAAASGALAKATADEVAGLRAEVHALHRDVDDLRRRLAAGQQPPAQRSNG